jgi:soluble lytic murein transglycosylase-like protein
MTYIPMTSFISSTEVLRKEHGEKRIREISASFPNLRSTVAADGLRKVIFNRIFVVINTYNPKLAPELKQVIANEIVDMSLRYDNLDTDLICATITHESALTWRPDIKSPAGAIGLMQLMPHTAWALSRKEDIRWTNAAEILNNPIYNIRLGCSYLSALVQSYHLDGGLAAYNGGSSRAEKWLASGRDDEVLFEETREYVPAVLRLYDAFKE